MESNHKPTVIFITGAFVSHACWDEWVDYFESKGFNAIAPAWPYKDGTAKALRDRQPNDTNLATLTLTELINHYATIAKNLSEKPIIIGHSLGGLITQILVNRNLAAFGVAIHPVPPMGIIPYEFKFLRSTWKVLGLFSSLKKTYLMSFKDFQRAFVNGMPYEVQKTTYEKLAIPESKTAARDGLTSAAAVDFNKQHVPLLITSGSEDNLIPPHLINRNYEKYKKNDSVLEYREVDGRNHNILGQPTWKQDADYILSWLDRMKKQQQSNTSKILNSLL